MEPATAKTYIQLLGLQPHPEGGYYKETYRDKGQYNWLPGTGEWQGKRNFSTAIYFLMEEGNFSAFHRIKSDEVWHFYAGDTLEVIEINEKGQLIKTLVGPHIQKGEIFQYVVKAGHWFGSRVAAGGSFALVGCTVAPGFDFADFEMAEREKLLQEFPQHQQAILELTRI